MAAHICWLAPASVLSTAWAHVAHVLLPQPPKPVKGKGAAAKPAAKAAKPAAKAVAPAEESSDEDESDDDDDVRCIRCALMLHLSSSL